MERKLSLSFRGLFHVERCERVSVSVSCLLTPSCGCSVAAPSCGCSVAVLWACRPSPFLWGTRNRTEFTSRSVPTPSHAAQSMRWLHPLLPATSVGQCRPHATHPFRAAGSILDCFYRGVWSTSSIRISAVLDMFHSILEWFQGGAWSTSSIRISALVDNMGLAIE